MELIEFIPEDLIKSIQAADWRLGARSYFASVGQFTLPLVGMRPVLEALNDSTLGAGEIVTWFAAFLFGSMLVGAALGFWLGGFVGDRLSKVSDWTPLRRGIVGLVSGLLPGLIYVGAVLLCLKEPEIITQYYGITILTVVGCSAAGVVVAERM